LLPIIRFSIFAGLNLNNIVKDKLHIEKLTIYFKGKESFETKDIARFFKEFEPDISQTTVNWRIYTLVKRGILYRIGKGIFALGAMNSFIPEISLKEKSISKKINKEFPYLEFCIWNTSVLNEFTLHQANQFYQLIEVEKDAIQAVFLYLKENKYSVFLEPTKDIFEKYIIENNNILIVKTLVTEAPTQNIEGINTSTLEKILVDIFCDEIIFSAYQGNEMRIIYNEAFSKYSINRSKLFRYANRRGRKEELKTYISTNLWQQI
jgi:DNA-binding Lrp family transcriptional regulator